MLRSVDTSVMNSALVDVTTYYYEGSIKKN